ncbi:hypothetical protein BGW41_004896 [Actinomortierella wolfii]|nr:hypothetical protein BGW41_004896 [Actinomortierella wolfii]
MQAAHWDQQPSELSSQLGTAGNQKTTIDGHLINTAQSGSSPFEFSSVAAIARKAKPEVQRQQQQQHSREQVGSNAHEQAQQTSPLADGRHPYRNRLDKNHDKLDEADEEEKKKNAEKEEESVIVAPMIDHRAKQDYHRQGTTDQGIKYGLHHHHHHHHITPKSKSGIEKIAQPLDNANNHVDAINMAKPLDSWSDETLKLFKQKPQQPSSPPSPLQQQQQQQQQQSPLQAPQDQEHLKGQEKSKSEERPLQLSTTGKSQQPNAQELVDEDGRELNVDKDEGKKAVQVPEKDQGNVGGKVELEDGDGDGGDDSDDDNDDDESNDNNETSSPVAPQPAPVEKPTTHGLIPSVIGAHHCTPQFCVNVSISDDGQTATFHIERDRAATGWISLGIGYAMTLADILIFWPNPKAGPHGATFSRRIAHSYIEPRDVSAMDEAEAARIPVSEYIFHNAAGTPSATSSSPSSALPAAHFDPAKKFVVQFSRPLKVKRSDFDLKPGRSQDFCWAYSPIPISPDQVADPAAHIQQHMSVGSFAMDVGANQPKLKEVLAKLKEKEAQEEAERKKKEKDAQNSDTNRVSENKHGLSKHYDDDTEDEFPSRNKAKTSDASTFAHRKNIQALGLVQSSSLLILTTVFLAKVIVIFL